MKLGHLVASVALAAALVAAPLAAHADTSVGTCEIGLVLPERLAITGITTPYGARIVGEQGCYFRATWDVSQGLISTGRSITFYKPASSGFQSWYGAPARVHALAAPGASSLDRFVDPVTGIERPVQVVERPSNTMTVKYGSRIGWGKPRMQPQGRVLLRSSVASISAATAWSGNYDAWTGSRVQFQHKERGVWKTVATARADRTGSATVRTQFLRGDWRVRSLDSADTWGKVSGVHRL